MAVHEQAMEAVESGDPDTLIFVSDFGAAPMRVGEKTGDRRLLEASVEALRRASDATPPGHVRKAERLNNLASASYAV